MPFSKDDVIRACIKKYGSPDIMVFSPGRANIIGEHTDYSGGYVLPFATQYGIFITAKKNKNRVFEIFSLDTQSYEIYDPSSQLQIENKDWTRFFKQSLFNLGMENYPFGLSIMIGGNLPIGAGMSSSSALTCGFLSLINEVYQKGLSKRTIMDLAVKAEHGTGVKGGMMDQYTILFAESKKALFINCQIMQHQLIDVNPEDFGFYLINTKVKHDLVDSPYNQRREQSEAALLKIKQIENSETVSFKNLASIEKYKSLLTPINYKRALHIITENQRVKSMVNALEKNDLNECGFLLKQSHNSLKYDYEVSCEELDFLVDTCSLLKNWKGGRMMGGGFGGCTINVFSKKNLIESFEIISQSYYEKFGVLPDIFEAIPSGPLCLEFLNN